MGRDIGYIRATSIDQNTGRQLAGIQLDVEYEEKISDKNKHRPILNNLLKEITDGDIVHVQSMDRLARSSTDLAVIVREIVKKGATVKFKKEGLEFKGDKQNPITDLMLGILGSVAEFERAIIKERREEGVAAAKTKGVYPGKITPEIISEIKAKISIGIPKTKIAKEMGISRSALYLVIK